LKILETNNSHNSQQVIKIVSQKYSKKDTIKYLYDAIGSLAFNVKPEVVQSDAVEPILMEVIIQKWNESHFNDVEATVLVGITKFSGALIYS